MWGCAAHSGRTTHPSEVPHGTATTTVLSVLDHVGINVSDFAAARAFYVAALEPLGIRPLMEFATSAGFGDERKPYFWIHERGTPTPSAHIAFASPDRATVDAFHAAALIAGGRDNGSRVHATTTSITTAGSYS